MKRFAPVLLLAYLILLPAALYGQKGAVMYSFNSTDYKSGLEAQLLPNFPVSFGAGYQLETQFRSPVSHEAVPTNPLVGFDRSRVEKSKLAFGQIYIQPVSIKKRVRPFVGIGASANWSERTDTLAPFVKPGADLSDLHPIMIQQLQGSPMVDTKKRLAPGGLASIGAKVFLSKHLMMEVKGTRFFSDKGLHADKVFISFGATF